MNLANITRLHNITASVSYMRKMYALIHDYSKKRKVFGKFLSEMPLHIVSLSKINFIYSGCLILLFQLVKMQGKMEFDKSYKNSEVLRMISSIAKLFVGRYSEIVCLEGIQCFGGVGYLENSNIPVILRDTIVTSIWEGTINTLSFDFFKNIKGHNLESFLKLVKKIYKRLNESNKINSAKNYEVSKLTNFLKNMITDNNINFVEEHTSRSLSFLYKNINI